MHYQPQLVVLKTLLRVELTTCLLAKEVMKLKQVKNGPKTPIKYEYVSDTSINNNWIVFFVYDPKLWNNAQKRINCSPSLSFLKATFKLGVIFFLKRLLR